MDVLLGILRTSTDNEERRKAALQLRQVQEDTPADFLRITWEGIASPALAPEERFFLASTMLEFVEQSWRNALPKDVQLDLIDRYAQLLLSEPLPSLSLARKVATVLCIMVMRSGAKAMPGALPAPTDRVARLLCDACVRAASGATVTSMGFLTQCLLTLHIFLKEAQRKRLNNMFGKLCTLLVPAMSNLFASSASWDHVEFYLPLLYLMKGALRVFGVGVFEPSFYPYLLTITWNLTRGVIASGQQQNHHQLLLCRQRLLEYALKVQLKAVGTFPARLSELSPEFFLARGGTLEGTASLFRLLVSVIETPLGFVASKKMLFRSMALFTALMMEEDSVEFTKGQLIAFADSPLLHCLMEHVTMLLADDVRASMLQEWETEPERFVLEFDTPVVDDDESVTGAAEELLLALTGSTNCAARSLAVEWQIVNAFLASDDLARVTAALHAIGICYHTMSVGQDPTGYLAFLTGKLLPLICGADAAPTSSFVLRRVVWMTGMWCDSVQDTSVRREVHAAFGSLLVSSTSTVVLLTLLRSIGNFITDANFSREELTPDYVQNVLLTIQRLLPQLRTPSSVRVLAELMCGLVSCGVLNAGNGERLLDVVLPAVYRFIGEADATVKANEHDDDSELDAGSLGVLLQCTAACTQLSSPEMEYQVWSLFPNVVLPCTMPEGKLTLWVEDNAWEMLLEMSHNVHAWSSVTRDALAWCLQNMKREAAVLSLVVRCAYCLLLLCPHPVELVDAEMVDRALELLTQSQCTELLTASFAMLGVMARRGNLALRCHLLDFAVQRLLSTESVQAEFYGVQLTLLLVWCLPPYGESAGLDFLLQAIGRHPNATSFVERLVLLLDVSPCMLATEQLKGLLHLLLTERPQPLMDARDVAMVQRALEVASTQVQQDNWDDHMLETQRDPADMLLELFGDQGVANGSPHILRLFTLFGIHGNSSMPAPS
ncbi:hypothetical protein TraAM80_02178 [Trypanosoma rangeli]|uniref:Importin N-terminal domain-containing protein n=1 Tax=Trypanosoma rangeli TaxID=5698 RepID=A0A3S5IS01_TRYRA|nr:uncharacterized protein TraAM80_02178 [Trypanosoma rangeli]RNF09466.1 hypothetical protein TraAM80_02178 [Trypanosoma rangeli]|eukprot:RNF09466.1 hypothetical protein TraAM80_02178 [Trypanosoma rangeli]